MANMLRQITFLRRGRDTLPIVFGFTDTLDMNLFRFAQFTTVFTLSYGTTFLLDLEQGTVGVLA